jgi:hypothetical protein
MSAFMELIDLSTMMGRLVRDGKVVHTYKMETCDKCQKIRALDPMGFDKEGTIWQCRECRYD